MDKNTAFEDRRDELIRQSSLKTGLPFLKVLTGHLIGISNMDVQNALETDDEETAFDTFILNTKLRMIQTLIKEL